MILCLQVLLIRHDGSGDEDCARKLYMSNKKTFLGLLQKVAYILSLWRLAEEDDDFEESTIALSAEKTVSLRRDEQKDSLVAVLNTFDSTSGEQKRGLMFTLFKEELEAVDKKADELRKTWEINESVKASTGKGSGHGKKKITSLRMYKWLSSDNIDERDHIGCLTESECRTAAQKTLGKKGRFEVIKSSFKIPSREEIMKYTIATALEILRDEYTNKLQPTPAKRMKRIESGDFIDQLLEKKESVEIASQKVIEQLRILSMQQHNMFAFQPSQEIDFNTVLKETVEKYRKTETLVSIPPILRRLVEDCVYSMLPTATDEDSEDSCDLVMA